MRMCRLNWDGVISMQYLGTGCEECCAQAKMIQKAEVLGLVREVGLDLSWLDSCATNGILVFVFHFGDYFKSML